MTHLRQAMLEELQRRNYAKTTVESYIRAVEQFAKHFKRPDAVQSLKPGPCQLTPNCSDDQPRYKQHINQPASHIDGRVVGYQFTSG